MLGLDYYLTQLLRISDTTGDKLLAYLRECHCRPNAKSAREFYLKEVNYVNGI